MDKQKTQASRLGLFVCRGIDDYSALFASAGMSGVSEVSPGLALILRMAAVELSTNTAVKRACGMATPAQHSAESRKRN